MQIIIYNSVTIKTIHEFTSKCMPNFTAVEVQICVYTGFVEYAKNEEKLTEAPEKNVKN